MANEQNLQPGNANHTFTPEEAQRGRAKSAEVRRQRKTLKEELLLLLSQGQTQEKISLALLEKAMSGDTKAFEVIRDSIGEKPIDKVEAQVQQTTINVKLDDEE